ncbi:hypothetical protein ABBQ38_002488 [Trebouxia sp. C0009 RCD-2024]
MSGQDQVQAVRQEIEDNGREASEVKATLAQAEQAGDLEKVRHLRTLLEHLDKARVSLHHLLLRDQQGGASSVPASTYAAERRAKRNPSSYNLQTWRTEQRLSKDGTPLSGPPSSCAIDLQMQLECQLPLLLQSLGISVTLYHTVLVRAGKQCPQLTVNL